jgi:hypothetical protein
LSRDLRTSIGTPKHPPSRRLDFTWEVEHEKWTPRPHSFSKTPLLITPFIPSQCVAIFSHHFFAWLIWIRKGFRASSQRLLLWSLLRRRISQFFSPTEAVSLEYRGDNLRRPNAIPKGVGGTGWPIRIRCLPSPPPLT